MAAVRGARPIRFPHAAKPCFLVILAAFAPAQGGEIDFNQDVLPVLARRCFLCHGPDESSRKAGLRLDDRAAATAQRRGGGRAITPGDAAASLLTARVQSPDSDERMPPSEHAPLSAREIDLLVRWIDAGAVYDRPWAWRPVAAPSPPAVRDDGWTHDDVDRFILAALEPADSAERTQPPAEADRGTLIRRVSFDLVGLPPAPADIAAFVDDDDPGAYERVVDRLLDSPRFGERWARHWLDLVRYAETHGHEFDYPIRHAWQYRDYVIRAMNADVPYDDFVREHLAGDLLETPRRHHTEGFDESIIGTGFWFLGQGTHAPVDVRGDEAERVANQIDVMSKTFLGITVACARCHDHKFDPITQRDFTALSGYLQSSRRQEAYLDPEGRIADAAQAFDELGAAGGELLAAVLSDPETADGLDAEQYVRAAIEAMDGEPQSRDASVIARVVVFEDFEGPDYGAWTAEGTAFGAAPQQQATIAPYQGDVAAHGRGFVSTHNKRDPPVGQTPDAHLGTLTSAVFRIEKPYIHFLIGGGAHEGKTCLNLLAGDEVVRSATGRNHNRMHRERFDVRDLAGREARFQIVDAEAGGWGQIGVDHIVFSEDTTWQEPLRRPVQIVAREQDVDAEQLHRWVQALRADRPPGVLDDRQDEEESAASADATSGAVVFEDFDDPRAFDRWFVTGAAFGDRPPRPGEVILGSAAPRLASPGTAHSGLRSPALQGTIRSATFTIEHDTIIYHAAGRGGRLRVIIDGYVLNEYNPLLFEGMLVDVETPMGGVRFTEFRHDVSRYKGHRAHIEIIDNNDGFIAVDDITFKNTQTATATVAAPDPDPATAAVATTDPPPNPPPNPPTATQRATTHALTAFTAKQLNRNTTQLLNWLLEHDLVRPGTLRQRWADIQRQHETMTATLPAPMRVLAMTEGTPEDEHLFVRGDHTQLGPVVPRRFIESIAGPDQPPPRQGSGRLELADRLLAPENPLVARVMVNRVWQHLFGEGLVPTPDDFGALGDPPTNLELLDTLAGWYRSDAAWSTKTLIRRLVLTRTYRARRDHRRRLEGEVIRDAMLAVSGALVTDAFGPSVPVHLTPFMNGRGRPGTSGPLDGNGRRSVYVAVRRNFLSPMLLTFDAPVPDSTIGRRHQSNVPAQALTLMNDPFVQEQARHWARRIVGSDATVERRIDDMYFTALARPPSEDERAAAIEFLRSEGARRGAEDWETDEALWAELCHVLFNVKEFIFIG